MKQVYCISFTTKIQEVSQLVCSLFRSPACSVTCMEGAGREIVPVACKEEKAGGPQSERTKLHFPVGTQTKQMELLKCWSL